MAMEITIEKDEEDENIYTITTQGVNNNKSTRIETLWHGRDYYRYDTPVNDWISMIKKLQERQKLPKTLIISLVADCSEHYRNSNELWRRNWPIHMSKNPFELLQICVENHCLFYETEVPREQYGDKKYSPPTSLLRLFSDDKTIVVGVGIEDVAKKLENDFYLKISKFVDLRIMAREKGYEKINKNCSVLKLAKIVLGDEWDHVNKPSIMDWWMTDSEYYDFLSDDKVKFGSLEAFLAYKIGTKLLGK